MDYRTIRKIERKASRIKRRIGLRVLLRWCSVGGGIAGAAAAFVLWAATGLHTVIDPVGPAALGVFTGAAMSFCVCLAVVSLYRAVWFAVYYAARTRKPRPASTNNTG